jgi:hypothetical protein
VCRGKCGPGNPEGGRCGLGVKRGGGVTAGCVIAMVWQPGERQPDVLSRHTSGSCGQGVGGGGGGRWEGGGGQVGGGGAGVTGEEGSCSCEKGWRLVAICARGRQV